MDLGDIAAALKGHVFGGEVLAPGPGHSPKDRSLSVRLSPSAPDGFLVHSFAGDNTVACRDHVRQRVGLERWPRRPRLADASRPIRPPDSNAAEAKRAAFVREQIATIVRELVPVRGTPGEQYLREVRRIDCDLIADVLARTDAIGWHPSVLFREDGHPLDGRDLGCVVGVMTDAITARPTGAVSRTYIDADLKKIGKARTLGSPAGVVRLSRDEDVLAGLFIAEGLETALAAMAFGFWPMWSTGSNNVMAQFPVLAGVECLTIIADNDANGAGDRAARKTAERWFAAGREVRIVRPKVIGEDLNDITSRRAGP
jgi:putative DNA primase/helicase